MYVAPMGAPVLLQAGGGKSDCIGPTAWLSLPRILDCTLTRPQRNLWTTRLWPPLWVCGPYMGTQDAQPCDVTLPCLPHTNQWFSSKSLGNPFLEPLNFFQMFEARVLVPKASSALQGRFTCTSRKRQIAMDGSLKRV